MNQLLFDRSIKALGPQAFARIQTSRLIHSIQLSPRLRFNGGETEAALVSEEQGESLQARTFVRENSVESKIWAHQSGVNALAIDIENRL